MNTIYLDRATWDLDIDAQRNIAMATDSYAVAQDAASACRVWSGEMIFDTARGVPYGDILGQNPPTQQIAGWFEREAGLVPGVATAKAVVYLDRTTRSLGGQMQLTLTTGESLVIGL